MSMDENLKDIRARVERAARKSGRSPEDIMLIGVTKTIDTDRIDELIANGVHNLGENRVQELLQKYDVVSNEMSKPAWHLIGHLQTNKVKYIIDKVAMIHSVDSLRLAEEIDRRARAIGRRMDVLIEVNAGDELSKFGVGINDTAALADAVAKLPNVCLRGLMTVAPYVEKSEKNREIFKKMRTLLIDIAGKISNNEKAELSMGMSNDYETAIEEGATMIRIGTGIFGTRKA